MQDTPTTVGVFYRIFLDELFRPEKQHWKARLQRVAGKSLTDCKSLRDMCRKEGSLPSERRAALDVQDLRDGLESDNTKLVWVTTDRMAADALTKRLKDQRVLDGICQRGIYHWMPSTTLRGG